MNKIICPKCGEVDFYGVIEVIKHRLVFDADGEPNYDTEWNGIYNGRVPRCLKCNSKVKIIESEEQDGKSN